MARGSHGRWAMRLVLLGGVLLASVAACSDHGNPGSGDDASDDDGSIGDDDGSTGDDDDDDGGGPPATISVCATGAPYTKICDAIAAAAPGDTVDVCPGTYPELISIIKPIHLRGAGSASTTIDGLGGGTTVAVGATGDAAVEIEGFTITGGASSAKGGGVRCDASTLILRASVLVDNTAAGGGGGLYASGCAIEVDDVELAKNTGGPTGGGALLEETTGTVHDSLFDGNEASHGAGLAIVEGMVSLVDSELRENHAGTQGGGLWLASDAEIAGTSIHDNHAGWTAGGIYVSEHAPQIHDNTVRANTCVNDGAGFYLHRTSATLHANVVADNVAGDDAGGIRVFESTAVLDANTIEHNTSADGGGGIKVSHVPSLLTDNLIRDNVSGTGGGIMMDNDASTVRGGEISGNTASSGGAIYATLGPWNGAVLEDIRIAGNHAWIGGGVTLTRNFMPVTMRRLTIVDNSASNVGGGILARGSDYTLDHSVVARNTALAGGALYHGLAEAYTDPCPCPMTVTIGRVTFSVLTGNLADTGSAIQGECDGLTVENSILAGHDGVSVVVTSAPTWRYTDATPATFSGMTDPTGIDGNLAADPAFVNPAGDDFHLAAGSACIDAGDPALSDPDGTRADLGRFGGAM